MTGRRELRSRIDGSVLGTVAQHDAAAVEEAVVAVTHAFPATRGLSRHRRSMALAQVAATLAAEQEDLARLIVAEVGKPIRWARQEVARAVVTFGLAAEEARRSRGEVLAIDIEERTEGYGALFERFPIGPVLAVTPFNFPLNLVAHKVAPAIAAGNPVLLKPAPQAPLVAERLRAIVARSGLPPGTLEVVHCEPALAERLVADDRFALLSFTGSARVGWHLKARAGRKRLVLELGGDAAVVVHDDADLDLAARRAAVGGFAYAGQVCIAVQRLLVQRSVYPCFRDRLVQAVAALGGDDLLADDTIVGPLIDAAAADRVMSWIDEARDAGGTTLSGGRREAADVVAPTIIEQPPPRARVSTEEVFGPVVTVDHYDSFEEALARVNASRFGLQVGVFTRDVGRVRRAFTTLEVGAVIVGDVPTLRVDNYPYGGVKESGLGREGVRSAMDAMSEPRVLVLAPD